VERWRVTRAHLVPPIILGLTKHPAVLQHDMASLRMIISAAAPLHGALEEACLERLREVSGGASAVQMKQCWGMSELSPIGTFTADDGLRPLSGTVGPPVANTEVKEADEAHSRSASHTNGSAAGEGGGRGDGRGAADRDRGRAADSRPAGEGGEGRGGVGQGGGGGGGLGTQRW
jgi:acyl-CoA synthetase (AMP-forming)/AMP-acid ligase II